MKTCTPLFVLVALSLTNVQAQQAGEISYLDTSVMPDGIVGQRIRSVIETLNSADPDRIRRLIEEETAGRFQRMPVDAHIDAFLGSAHIWGEVSFHGVRTYQPAREETVVILKDQNFGAWRAFTMRLDPNQDDRIVMLGFNDARTPTNAQEPPITVRQMIDEITNLVRRVCTADVFSGSVLVARGDELLVEQVCGEASKRFHVANNLDTKFNLGSMNKMFTSVSIAQLVEAGRLSFQDPISRYLDESWLPREITDRVTIHHLLSHTSGLGSYFNQTYWDGSRELYRTVDDFKPLVQGDQLAFEPGTDYRYSNTGMLLLGAVIESVTGGSYFEYVRGHIYGPAGMNHSDSYEMDFPVENLAIGYIPARDSEYGWENNIYKHVIKGGPAGGGFSTVRDLYRFANALTSGRLVSVEMLDTLWTDHSEQGYGYGFGIQAGPGGRVVGHGGGFPGLNGNLDIFVDSDYVVAVLANYDRAAGPVATRINSLIRRLHSTR